MKKILLLLFSLISFSAWSQADNCTLEIKIEGAMGAATVDYLERAMSYSDLKSCDHILMLINTPGGNLESTRRMVEVILNSSKPFLCVVAPSGAHAGSAGAILLQACTINGALVATNIGAATPILGTGQDMPSDLRNKMINDTVSWLEGVTRHRNRNLDFSKKIITEAKSATSEEAYKIGAIDILAKDIPDFLEQAKNVLIKKSKEKDFSVDLGFIEVFRTDSRYQVLQFFSDPQFSYMLFMGSLALIYFEITHPGTIVPGTLGTMGLIISLISFHKLDVWWGGVALIILALILFVLEAFVTSFGVLAVGGIISFVLGGLFLFDAQTTGYALPLMTIIPSAVIMSVLMLGVGYLLSKSRNLRVRTGADEMIGRKGTIVKLYSNRTGKMHVFGEMWDFLSDEDVTENDELIVQNVKGLKLIVKKKG